jgi:2-dehydro-3-deoxygluconokinase
MKKFITFGEIMLRLKSPGKERFFQSPVLEASFGGGEANVAVGLARLGLDAFFTSALPENMIGHACISELKKQGVQTDYILRKGERMGIYFLEGGANQRPSRVIYDRANSALCTCKGGDFAWEEIFKNGTWFHVTGITPALSEASALLAIEAVQKAKQAELIVSCDLNYRKKLWNYGKTAREVMSEILPYVDIVIANEEDCQKTLGINLDIDVESGCLDNDAYKHVCKQVFSHFPSIKKIAITMRESHSANHNGWSAILYNGQNFYRSKHYEITNIVDRVGGGDSFSAGLIYGLSQLENDKKALEFAVAVSCLKHSIPGDFPLVNKNEVESLLASSGSGRISR